MKRPNNELGLSKSRAMKRAGLRLSREDVRAQFDRAGITIRQWAKEHGYSPGVVEDLLRGKSIGRRGQAHNVAVRLGMKCGTVNPAHEPGQAKAEAKP